MGKSTSYNGGSGEEVPEFWVKAEANCAFRRSALSIRDECSTPWSARWGIVWWFGFLAETCLQKDFGLTWCQKLIFCYKQISFLGRIWYMVPCCLVNWQGLLVPLLHIPLPGSRYLVNQLLNFLSEEGKCFRLFPKNNPRMFLFKSKESFFFKFNQDSLMSLVISIDQFADESSCCIVS